MTVIIGLRLPPSDADQYGSVLIGGDTLGTSYTPQMTRIPRTEPKVFRNGKYIFGASGDYLLPELLFAWGDPPDPPLPTAPEDAIRRWLISTMRKSLQSLFEEAGFDRSGPDCQEYFLMGWGPHLYAWWLGTMQFIRSDNEFEVIGTGADVAYGVMRATEGVIAHSRARIQQAITVAAERCGTVAGLPVFASTSD